MAPDDVERLLQASMGLNALSIGAATIARAVADRRSICNLGPQAYVERLHESAAELQALIEAVVVPETWFFRDRPAFAALVRLVQERLTTHPSGVLTVLSLPCSTGEEPYSMAMALLDADVPATRFRIDAVDISARHVAIGIRATYGRNSFRGDDLAFRERHFERTAEGYRLSDDVRRKVRFQQGNLFAVDLLPGTAAYDVIFCRNVLIYFDRRTQSRALDVITRLLRANGVLFVAPAETALPAGHGMVSTHQALAFAFRKSPGGPAVAKPAVMAGKPVPVRPPVVPDEERYQVRSTAARAVVPPRLPQTLPGDGEADFSQARRLADQGHFVEAANVCAELLRQHGPSAPAFYLMGLVRDATGNHTEAAAYYRKALYLSPDHYEAQIHLALLMEKQGDPAAALVLRNRARRLERKRQAPNG